MKPDVRPVATNLVQSLVDQVKDQHLRSKLAEAILDLKKLKKFGLVFEEHLPELVPVYSEKVKRGSRVTIRDGSVRSVYVVKKVTGHIALCDADNGSAADLEIPVESLTVVKRFGEPIFPALRHVESVVRDDDAAHHVLIEADNYHGLQLLAWLYAGKVDCIYIDPPYNTGARDWKYNNDYVDKNDLYHHSKWLSMMKRRLEIAIKLLKPRGIACVTVDDYELHHLRCLLEENFNDVSIVGTIPIRNNPSGRSTVTGLSICHEYAVLLGKGKATLTHMPRSAEQWDRFSEEDENGLFAWRNFRKDGGEVTYRSKRPRQYYPIYVNGSTITIPNMEYDKSAKEYRNIDPPSDGDVALWPTDEAGNDRIWMFSPNIAKKRVSELVVRGNPEGPVIFRKYRPSKQGVLPRSWWDKTEYSAREYGTPILKDVFGENYVFPFAKSPYAVRDCLWICGAANPHALILDFFAGSGTTLQAVLELNAVDGGSRRCILITNNEVFPELKATELRLSGLRQGNDDFDKHGVCRSVTFPRCKTVITGKRTNGSPLTRTYATGKVIDVEMPRRISMLDFVSWSEMRTLSSKRKLARLLGIPPIGLTETSRWHWTADSDASVLFDANALDAFLEAGAAEEALAARTIFMPPMSSRKVREVQQRLTQDWPPLIQEKGEVRAYADGFAANLDYFRLDFLEQAKVETGSSLSDILPLLWMMSGARGPLPTCIGNEDMLLPARSPFAVLVQGYAVRRFIDRVAQRTDIEWIFLVTNSDETFARLSSRMPMHVPVNQRVHLYRNYLENFVINVARSRS